MEIHKLNDSEKNMEKILFLSAFNLLLSRYGLSWKDVDIDFDMSIINVKTEVNKDKLLDFIADLEDITGKLK